jgi:flagellar biosynthesis/type III secretory pathway chaperone
MRAVLFEITGAINLEIDCLRSLLDVVHSERDALKERQHERLISLAERKIALCNELAGIQQKRRGLIQQVVGNKSAPAKLKDLTPLLEEDEREPFQAAVRQIRELARNLERINSLNRTHVEEALDTVEHVLSILTGQNRKETYVGRGRPPTKQAPRMLARQV